MTEQTLYESDTLKAWYDGEYDFIKIFDEVETGLAVIPYFILEEIMENARKAHVMRNNLRMGGEE